MYKIYGDYLMHCSDDALAHHGILGMKWGVRRYQNEDGTLTDAGRKRYADDQADRNNSKEYTQFEKNAKKMIRKYFPDANNKEIKFDRIHANFKNRSKSNFVLSKD